jgi:hypothetical protein
MFFLKKKFLRSKGKSAAPNPHMILRQAISTTSQKPLLGSHKQAEIHPKITHEKRPPDFTPVTLIQKLFSRRN